MVCLAYVKCGLIAATAATAHSGLHAAHFTDDKALISQSWQRDPKAGMLFIWLLLQQQANDQPAGKAEKKASLAQPQAGTALNRPRSSSAELGSRHGCRPASLACIVINRHLADCDHADKAVQYATGRRLPIEMSFMMQHTCMLLHTGALPAPLPAIPVHD